MLKRYQIKDTAAFPVTMEIGNKEVRFNTADEVYITEELSEQNDIEASSHAADFEMTVTAVPSNWDHLKKKQKFMMVTTTDAVVSVLQNVAGYTVAGQLSIQEICEVCALNNFEFPNWK